MEWIKELLYYSGGSKAMVPNAIFLISLTIIGGVFLSKIKIKGISIGVTWVLFFGIFLSALGLTADNEILHFIKEFGLILFVYGIGMEVGPNFISSFKKGGLKLNILAVCIVSIGVIITLILWKLTGINLQSVVGIMSGAVTNTPGLQAAQQTYNDLKGSIDPIISQGYAVAYPLGVLGIITVIILLKIIFKIDLKKEEKEIAQLLNCKTENEKKYSINKNKKHNISKTFLAIILGVVLGSIPIIIPGVPHAVKLGLAGGPLIIAIILSSFSSKYKLITEGDRAINTVVKESGIALFLACVGLGAGPSFMDTLINKGGYLWVGYGFLITVIPILIIGIIGIKFLKINYFLLIGVISGSCTDPPALAYSNSIAKNAGPSQGYATVYPLVMFLRIIAAQLIILFLL